MATLDKYHAQETNYSADEAEYDAADYNFQIVDDSGDVVVLCPDEKTRDMILALLLNNLPENG